MKVIVSSKNLYKRLSEIDFNKESIYNVVLEDNVLRINANTKSVEIYCEIVTFKASIKQENRRWDWVKELCSKVEEQPITLHISENVVNVIFQY